MIVKLSRKKAHQVYKNAAGKIVPGGSTVSKVGENMQGLMDWYYRCGCEGIDPKAVVDEAAGIGSVGHFLIQCHFNGNSGDFSEFSKVEIDGGYKMLYKFLEVWKEQGLEFVASELQLVSEKHLYGGTLDLIARKEGALVLGDIKSSPKIRGAMFRQIAGYEALYNELHDEKIAKRLIIRLDKKSPTKTEVRWMGDMSDHFAVFLGELNLYHLFKTV